MGAIPWQVVHQNSKNSTNCRPPDAMLTVLGSVASRLGPREVAIGSCVAARASVGAAVAWIEVSDVDAAAGRVSLGITMVGCAGMAVEVAGAQAAKKTASRPRRVKRRLFLILL
jgi:hypothetical protein